YGRRRVFAIGIGLFTLGSLICGVATDTLALIGGRAVSGLGAALAVPTSLAILSDAYPDATARAHAIGVLASCNRLAWLIGPTLGGLVVTQFGWRAVFFLVVPIGLIAMLLTCIYVANAGQAGRRRIDVAGQVLGTLALGSLAFALIEAPHWGWTQPA